MHKNQGILLVLGLLSFQARQVTVATVAILRGYIRGVENVAVMTGHDSIPVHEFGWFEMEFPNF